MRSLPVLSLLLALALVALGAVPGEMPCAPPPSADAAPMPPCGGEHAPNSAPQREAPGGQLPLSCCPVCAANFTLRLKSEPVRLPVQTFTLQRTPPSAARQASAPAFDPPTPPPRFC